MGVEPAFISRVSNAKVLKLAHEPKMSQQLLQQQLLLFGKVARAGDDDLLRRLTFIGNTQTSATNRFVRRVGRPRNEWATMVQREAWKMSPQADQIIHNEASWKTKICQHCSYRD